MVFEGYLDDPAATAERLRRTAGSTRGTSAGSTRHGCLHVLDRRDDLIISGGENVSPAEVEAILRRHPDVRDVAVVGQPDPTWGSVPVAAVVLAAGSTVTDASLERHCRERLAGYKVPVRFHRLDRCRATPPARSSGASCAGDSRRRRLGRSMNAGNSAPPERIAEMFDRISGVYDAMNLAISGFQEPRWRHRAVREARLGPGGRALDVACGTGKVTRDLYRAVQPGGAALGVDFSTA